VIEITVGPPAGYGSSTSRLSASATDGNWPSRTKTT
jgi:hypothetical protein